MQKMCPKFQFSGTGIAQRTRAIQFTDRRAAEVWEQSSTFANEVANVLGRAGVCIFLGGFPPPPGRIRSAREEGKNRPKNVQISAPVSVSAHFWCGDLEFKRTPQLQVTETILYR